jgi:OOP family OmpA-OmpF porin
VRSSSLVGALMVCATATGAAQRARSLEFGGSVSVTRYDKLMGLGRRVGAGAHVGFFFTRRLSAELEGGFAQPRTQVPLVFTTVRWASASLVLNVGAGARNLPYVLGGYTRIDYGGNAPYDFADHAVHGAVGDRILLFNGAAVRFEGRAIYAPSTDPRFGGKWAGHLVGSIGLTMFAPSRSVGDADRDRVADAADACPDTPAGVPVDRRGCPLDSDGDAVANGIDRCPNTPTGAQVDRTGCPLDTDRDGVFDGIDQCAATPTGSAVDPRGCPFDADADGVADQLDRCPGTARGAAVDAAGCPARDSAAALFPVRGPVVLRGVSFETGSTALTPGSYGTLDGVAAAFAAHPDIRVEIAGYTDNAGAPGTNLRLSQLRAEAVRAYLVSRGVGAGRLTARGYGSANPVANNATAAGRAQNRRVELHRLP